VLRAGLEPATTSSWTRTGAVPARSDPQCAGGIRTRGLELPQAREDGRSSTALRARPSWRPGRVFPSYVALSVPLAHPSEGCWSPALDPFFTVGYSAMRGRRQLHCRKMLAARWAGRAFLSGAGPRSVSSCGAWSVSPAGVVVFGQQKGRPGGPPSRNFGGYAPYRLAHAPPSEGGDVVAVGDGAEDGRPEAGAVHAARRDGRDGCRACEPLGCRRVESHDGQFGVGE
jgi:hypothetical protein